MEKLLDWDFLLITKTDQHATIEELFKRSQPSPTYYTLLLLSSLIVAAGLLLSSATVIIGGMLVTPFLSPILLVALGMSVGEIHTIRSSTILIFKSIVIVVFVSLVLSILFGAPDSVLLIFSDSVRSTVLYTIVAFLSGIAATIAWTRKEAAEILPGIAIAVSIVPPLAMLGIGLSTWDVSLVRLSLATYIFNLIGVIFGSMVVFSLFKFYKTEKVVEKEAISQEKQIEEVKNHTVPKV